MGVQGLRNFHLSVERNPGPLELLYFAVIGSQNAQHFVNQSDLNLPMTIWSPAFSRALHIVLVYFKFVKIL